MKHPHLHIALRAAISARRIATLRQLFSEHGVLAFAQAIAAYSPRVAADALSLLSASERTSVLRHLPLTTREKLRPMGFEIDQNISTACRIPAHQLRRQFA